MLQICAIWLDGDVHHFSLLYDCEFMINMGITLSTINKTTLFDMVWL